MLHEKLPMNLEFVLEEGFGEFVYAGRMPAPNERSWDGSHPGGVPGTGRVQGLPLITRLNNQSSPYFPACRAEPGDARGGLDAVPGLGEDSRSQKSVSEEVVGGHWAAALEMPSEAAD